MDKHSLSSTSFHPVRTLCCNKSDYHLKYPLRNACTTACCICCCIIHSFHSINRRLNRDCRLMFSIWPKQPAGPIRFCFQSIKYTFLYPIPVVSAGYFVHSQWQRHSSPVKALFRVHVFVSGGRQLSSLFYPVRQLHRVCRVYAEEDVQDFR